MLERSKARAITERDVSEANRRVYNEKCVESYDANPSLFGEEQTRRLHRILTEIRATCGGSHFLDVGCGTGNVLRVAQAHFEECVGLDQAEVMLARVAPQLPNVKLVAAQAQKLPFPAESFDAVSMYALLHHLYDPLTALEEAARVLRPGGVLYTDHDPNLNFGRFYQLWCRLVQGRRYGFGTELEDIAEYHHTVTGGLDPQRLARRLSELGFRQIQVQHRHPTRDNFEGLRGLVLRAMKRGSRIFPAKSLYTHFVIMAQK